MTTLQPSMSTGSCCASVGETAFDHSAAVEAALGFSALADPVRLHLLSMIASAGSDGACVCDLVEPSGRSQPTVSHHLRILRQAGLIEAEKRGTWSWYRLVPDRLADIARTFETATATR